MRAGRPIKVKCVDWICHKIPNGNIFTVDEDYKQRIKNKKTPLEDDFKQLHEGIQNAKDIIEHGVEIMQRCMRDINLYSDILNQHEATLDWLTEEWKTRETQQELLENCLPSNEF